MGVVVTHRAIHLAEQFHALDALDGARQAGGHVGHFLAQRGRAGRLAVRARQHRLGGIGACQFHQAGLHALERGHQHAVTGALEHHAVRGVVDVFRGAGEMDELARGLQLGVALDLLLEPVLHGLDVVVGHSLDVLDAGGVGFGEVLHQRLQLRLGIGRELRHVGQAGLGQGDQPVDLDLHAVAHEGRLGEPLAQRVGLGGITAIDGRQCGERRKGWGGHAGNREKEGKTGFRGGAVTMRRLARRAASSDRCAARGEPPGAPSDLPPARHKGLAGIAQRGILPSPTAPVRCAMGQATRSVRSAALTRHARAGAGILALAIPVACYEVHRHAARQGAMAATERRCTS
ncbi:hypothetical protein D3C85_1037010 [compost metagenome]